LTASDNLYPDRIDVRWTVTNTADPNYVGLMLRRNGANYSILNKGAQALDIVGCSKNYTYQTCCLTGSGATYGCSNTDPGSSRPCPRATNTPTPTPTSTPTPPVLSCSGGILSPASVDSLVVGSSQTFVLSSLTGATYADVSRVVFGVDRTAVTLNPLVDGNGSDGFMTSATGVSVTNATTHLTADIYLRDNSTTTPNCSATAEIAQVVMPSPWWQTVGGDLFSMGNSSKFSGCVINLSLVAMVIGVIFVGGGVVGCRLSSNK
jgi:hypothetical protein